MASLFREGKYYVIQFTNRQRSPKSKKLRFKQGVHTKQSIRNLKSKLEVQQAEGTYDPWVDEVPGKREEQGIRLEQTLEDYIADKSKTDWGENTVYNYTRNLKAMVRGLKIETIQQLDYKMINKLINNNQWAFETKKSNLRMLKTFMRWLNKHYELSIQTDELKVYKSVGNEKKKIHYLSREEIETLKQHIQDKVTRDIRAGYQNKKRNSMWLVDLIDWQFYSGMRISETLNLRVGDIDTRTWEVTIGHAGFKTKTGEQDILPIGEVQELVNIARKYLDKNSDPDQRLFGRKDTKRTSRTFKNYLKQALPHRSEITMHDLRHSCCIQLLRLGVSIYTVSRWMRHSSIRTTQNYADLLKTDIGSSVGKAFSSI